MADMRKEIIDHIKPLLVWTVTGLIDSVFIILWVVVQYLTDRLVEPFKLTGINNIQFVIFQILFAISTLLPLLLWIFKDIIIMGIQVQTQIKQALQQASLSSSTPQSSIAPAKAEQSAKPSSTVPAQKLVDAAITRLGDADSKPLKPDTDSGQTGAKSGSAKP
jgi:hypothetical protein